MNITFFVGNGFDLNLGLKTSYKDFYEYYTQKCPNEMLAKTISSDYKLWADLELGLGKYLERVDESQVETFLNSKALLEYQLSLYLRNQMKRIQINNKEAFTNEFKEKVGAFYNEFSLSERRMYERFLSETSGPLTYKFISFNYTDTLDKIIDVFLSSKIPIATHACGGTGFNEKVEKPIHIHGTVNSIILGLNDETQINNESLRMNDELTDCIIKEKVNDALGELRIESVKQIMDNSKYICVFGMSIGETDNMWWIEIIEWLLKDSSRKLVLYARDGSTVQSVSSQESVRLYGRKRSLLLNKKQALDEAQIKDIKKRIIIVKNPKIFSFQNIEIKEENNGQTENDEQG